MSLFFNDSCPCREGLIMWRHLVLRSQVTLRYARFQKETKSKTGDQIGKGVIRPLCPQRVSCALKTLKNRHPPF